MIERQPQVQEKITDGEFTEFIAEHPELQETETPKENVVPFGLGELTVKVALDPSTEPSMSTRTSTSAATDSINDDAWG